MKYLLIPHEVIDRTIYILGNYIDEDELAEGHGGGTENPNFQPAKDLLAELKKIEKSQN